MLEKQQEIEVNKENKVKINNKTWKFGYKLSWELFSESIYSYRQTIDETKKHKLHMHCKNGIFAVITSLEAFINEILISEYKWSKTKLDDKKVGYPEKLSIIIKNFSKENTCYQNFNKYKQIRNNYLIHHKEDDYTYVDKINSKSLLGAIESVQEIIAKICFHNRNIPYPYWLCGLNFLNPHPTHNNDIDLLNDREFWNHIYKYSCIDTKNLSIIITHISIKYPDKWNLYKNLYQYIWDGLKHYNFNIEIESLSKIFPYMPYLSCVYWEKKI